MKWPFQKINEMKNIHINVIINEKHSGRNAEKKRKREKEREKVMLAIYYIFRKTHEKYKTNHQNC